MKRRAFITLLGGATGLALVARAQQAERISQIGVLIGRAESNAEAQAWAATVREKLGALGWTEGRNIQTDMRWVAPMTRRRGNDLRRNLSHSNPT